MYIYIYVHIYIYINIYIYTYQTLSTSMVAFPHRFVSTFEAWPGAQSFGAHGNEEAPWPSTQVQRQPRGSANISTNHRQYGKHIYTRSTIYIYIYTHFYSE